MSGSPRHRMHAATTAALALVAGLLIFVWPVVSVAQPIDIPPDTLPPKQTPPPVAPERPGEDDAAAGARANRILNAIAEAHNADEWRRHRWIHADSHVNRGND